MNRTPCPQCGKLLVRAIGQPGILLVGEYPGGDEVMSGIPFSGNAGQLLKSELALAGMSIQECRLTNLWLHKTSDDCNMDWHVEQLMAEIKESKFVLLMGTMLTNLLFDANVMSLSGLEMKSRMFPKVRFFVSPNPAQMFYSPIGEFRLALQHFVKEVRREL